jgi:hypothetical protein
MNIAVTDETYFLCVSGSPVRFGPRPDPNLVSSARQVDESEGPRYVYVSEGHKNGTRLT